MLKNSYNILHKTDVRVSMGVFTFLKFSFLWIFSIVTLIDYICEISIFLHSNFLRLTGSNKMSKIFKVSLVHTITFSSTNLCWQIFWHFNCWGIMQSFKSMGYIWRRSQESVRMNFYEKYSFLLWNFRR